MSKQNDLFRQIVDKYHLSDPVTSAHQEFILKSRKKNLKQILKKKGKYGLIFWAVLGINFIVRNFGIKISFVQSQVLLGLTTLTITAGTTTGVYQGAKYVYKEIIQKDEPVIEEQKEIKSEETLIEQIDKGKTITIPVNNEKLQSIEQKSPPISEVETISNEETTLKEETDKQTPVNPKKKEEEDPVTIIPSL